MIENGLYYIDDSFARVIQELGGEWNDTKHRPIICLIKSKENDRLYWAIPMGKLNHRTADQIKRIQSFINLPSHDLRSCFYHIGRTTAKSLFFISDAIPITDKYIKEKHLGADNQHFILKNPQLYNELKRKLLHILKIENENPNYFRQHITDVKKFLLEELSNESSETKSE